MPPPYARQTHVGAIVDWASDGSFAGLEIVWDTAALTSSNAEIERVKRERDDAKAALTRWGDVGVFNALQAANARFLLAEAEARTLRNAGVDLIDRTRAAEAERSELCACRDALVEALTELFDGWNNGIDSHEEAAVVEEKVRSALAMAKSPIRRTESPSDETR